MFRRLLPMDFSGVPMLYSRVSVVNLSCGHHRRPTKLSFPAFSYVEFVPCFATSMRGAYFILCVCPVVLGISIANVALPRVVSVSCLRILGAFDICYSHAFSGQRKIEFFFSESSGVSLLIPYLAIRFLIRPCVVVAHFAVLACNAMSGIWVLVS